MSFRKHCTLAFLAEYTCIFQSQSATEKEKELSLELDRIKDKVGEYLDKKRGYVLCPCVCVCVCARTGAGSCHHRARGGCRGSLGRCHADAAHSVHQPGGPGEGGFLTVYLSEHRSCAQRPNMPSLSLIINPMHLKQGHTALSELVFIKPHYNTRASSWSSKILLDYPGFWFKVFYT